MPFLLSCNDKGDNYKYLTFIKAGQIDGTGIRYVDIIPDDTIIIVEYPDFNFRKSTNPYNYVIRSINSINFFNATRNLDLDNDNVSDFELVFTRSDPGIMGYKNWRLEIKPLGMNSICVTESGNNWADSLKYNDTISNINNWSDSTVLLFDHQWSLNSPNSPIISTKGYWYDNDSIYLAVKIVKDSNQLYGWIDIKKNIIRQYGVTIPYQE